MGLDRPQPLNGWDWMAKNILPALKERRDSSGDSETFSHPDFILPSQAKCLARKDAHKSIFELEGKLSCRLFFFFS